MAGFRSLTSASVVLRQTNIDTDQIIPARFLSTTERAGLGKNAMQHRALAEVFALQGQTAGAIGQLELAIKAGDANFYEMSAIDARLRELKIRRLEELKDKN